jgi:hypothetical protein
MKHRALLLLALGGLGCSNTPVSPGMTGGAGNGVAGSTESTGAAGSNGDAGTPGAAGTTGGAGATGTAGAGAAGTTGSAGQVGAGGVGAAGAGAAGASAAGATGAGGSSDAPDPVAPRPLNVTPNAGCCSTGGLSVKSTAKLQGKLVLVLGGICGGPGGGGIESYAALAGFHIWKPSTQTCVNSAPQKYKDMLTDNDPTNDAEANRQVGDARMELWDGVDRVDWVTVAPNASIVAQTQAALKNGALNDQGGDWGYFLNADGTVRWTDVYVVGYSWGSQTLAMISSYVRFGRVFTTSGPQAEGFPNGTWITHPSATPNDRKYMSVGFNQPYPSMDKIDIAPNTVTSMIQTTMKAGWGNGAPPMNVLPGDKGPFAGAHLFAMVGSAPNTPGGHTVFCTDNPTNGWIPLCAYAFGVK